MRGKEILKINSRVDVQKDGQDGVYKSLIQDIEDECFFINVPIDKRHHLLLQKDDDLEVTVFHRNACFKFSTKVLGIKKEADFFLYKLKKPLNYKKIERRDFVRVETALQVTYEIIPDYSQREKVKPTHEACIIDLSAGGAQLLLFTALPYDAMLVLELPLPLDEQEFKLRLYGKVVRREDDALGNIKRYKTGIKFEDISERERDLIIKYIFKQMRKTMHLRRSEF